MQKSYSNEVRHSIIVSLLVLMSITFAYFAIAVPGGPDLTYIGNTSSDTSTPANRTDAKGMIHTLTMSAILQDQNWKAYVGNVSGILTLDDSNGYTIYDWSTTTATGEIYMSRDSSVSWTNINCSNYTLLRSEEVALSMTATGADGINRTFNSTTHKSFLVGSTNITESSCRSTATYVNDTRPTINTSSPFQEVLLSDGTNVIYTTFIENDETSYQGNSTYDFQAIVAENVTVGTAPLSYYFYVELG